MGEGWGAVSLIQRTHCWDQRSAPWCGWTQTCSFCKDSGLGTLLKKECTVSFLWILCIPLTGEARSGAVYQGVPSGLRQNRSRLALWPWLVWADALRDNTLTSASGLPASAVLRNTLCLSLKTAPRDGPFHLMETLMEEPLMFSCLDC